MSFKTLILATLALLLSGCQQASERASESETLTDGDYCYRNTFTNGDTTDVEELLISIEGQSATGEYNWLPQFKDQRKGNFEGKVSEQTINANYSFKQEGQSQSADITIVFTNTNATVEGGAPQLGLNRTLNKVDC